MLDFRRAGNGSCRRLVWAIAALGAVLALPAHSATLLRSQELPELVDESRRALLATVTGVHHDFDEHGLHSTFVRLLVDDRLYGQAPRPGEELTIKLYGAPDTLEDGSRVFVDGTPQYVIGQQYLLLLKDDSDWGFTNVAGLFQGVFEVGGKGRAPSMAESLAGNRAVFREGGLARWLQTGGLAPDERAYAAVSDGPVPYSLLRRTVVQLKHQRGDR